MYDVQISHSTYELAAQAAREEKVSIPEYVDQVVQDAAIQRMFTPERLAHIAKSDAEIDAGEFFTADEVDEFFKQKSKAWEAQRQQQSQ